jgi:hypothetical protein
VTVKFGIKALSMLSGLALALVIVTGCTEDTPPDTKPTTTAPSAGPGPKAPDKAPAAAPAPTKPEEPKK